MRAVALAALIALAGCGPAVETAAGFVVDVKSTSLTQIDAFTLRTPEGEELVFRIGALDLNGGGFPGAHLREHMVANQAVAVAYTEQDGERVASKLADATWLRP